MASRNLYKTELLSKIIGLILRELNKGIVTQLR